MSPANYSRPSTRIGAPNASAHVRPITRRIPDDLGGLRLDQALARMLTEHSRSRLKAWIEAGHVRVDGAAWDATRRVIGGERVEVKTPAAAALLSDVAEDIALAVVFEDDTILIVDKPAGLVVHPGSGNRDGTLLNALLHHDAALSAVPRAGIVHRLDKETSGLMAVAKTIEAQTDLVRQLAAHQVTREYIAVARGDLARDTIVDAPIGRHPTQRTTMAVVGHGKPARTHVAVIERFGIATLLRCTLETGRTHQIRVHLAAIGHPLVGDPEYGGRRGNPRAFTGKANNENAVPRLGRQALHATRLSLTHPVTRRTMQWNASSPPDIVGLIDALRRSRMAGDR